VAALCDLDAVPEAGAKGFEVGSDSVFAVRRDGRIYLYRNRCPHRGVELNWLEDQFLDRDGTLIQCALHGALFVIESGECVAGPCLGQRLTPVPFEVVEGRIEIRLEM
jgi:nitrite reductase/ring-hydroxylating ferredoxin subunit